MQPPRASWVVLAAAYLAAPEAARAGCDVTGNGLINCNSGTIDIRPAFGSVTAIISDMNVSGGSLNLIPADVSTGPITATLVVNNTTIERLDYSAIVVASTIPGGPVVDVSVTLGRDVTLISNGGFGGLWVRNEWGGNIVVNSAATVTATGADGLTATTNNGSVSLTNSGLVTSTDNRGLYADGGFSNTSPVPVTISNSGTVSAYLAGIRAIDYNGTATILNSGSVTSTTKQAAIAWSNNGDAVTSNSGTLLALNNIGMQAASQTGHVTATNSGRIEARLATPGGSYQGINAQAGFDTSEAGWGNVTVTNTATGVVIAPNDSAIYAWTPQGQVNVQNAGSLSGAMGVTADATSGSVTIGNTGSITATGAAIVTGAAPATLTNAGSIATTGGGAAVQFGTGNSTLIVLPGSSIRGLVTGGTSGDGLSTIGTNTLTLGGSGSASFDVSQIDRTPAQRGLAFNGTAYVGTASAAAGQYQGFSLFTKTGDGTWTLTSGSGGGLADQNWSIQGGTLVGDASTIRGQSIVNNAILVFNQGSAGTYAGAISGSGSLVVTGGGALTLAGANTHTGGTVIRGATLRIASDAALGASTGSLTFDNGTLQALANLTSSRPIVVASGGGLIDTNGFLVSLLGPITLNGQLSKTGAGNVLFSSDAEVNGTMVVGNGTFANNGVVSAQQVQVLPGGVLRGSGIVNAPTFVSGTLYPGNSPGTLTFNAPVTMQPGSTLALDIDGTGTGNGAGNYGRVVVQGAGNGFAAAGTIQPVLRGITGSATNSFTPSLGQSFNVVQAQGGVTGSFSGIAQPGAGLPAGTRFETVYTAQTVSLALAPSSYAALGLGQTDNQVAVGSALDVLRPTPGVRPGAGLGDAFGRLYQLSAAAIAPTLDRLAGTAYGDQLLADRETQRLVGGAVDDQLSGLRGGSDASGRTTTLADGRGRTAWIRALGQNQRVDSGAAPGFSGNTAGFIAGADVRVENAVLGLAVGHTGGRFTSRGTGAKTDTDAVHLIAYGSLSLGRYFLDGQLGGHMTSDTTRRDLGVFGSSARGRVDGAGVSAQARFGTAYTVQGWRLEPSVAVRFDHTGRDALTETGAGGLGLAVNRTSIDGVRTSASIRVDREFALAEGISVAPSLRLGYAHDFGDATAITNAAFLGAPSAGYRVTSARPGRDVFLAGAGATVKLPHNLAVFVNYAADIRGSGSVQAITGGLRFTW